MTVYLTDGRRHLVCRPYSIAGLHRMAADLGIDRRWFHAGRHPHYDVPKRRIAEIEARCEVVSSREIVALIEQARAAEQHMLAHTYLANQFRYVPLPVPEQTL